MLPVTCEEIETDDRDRENTTLKGTPGKLDPDDVDLPPNEDLSPAPIEGGLGEWFFVDRKKLNSKTQDSLERSTLEMNLQMK